MNARILEQKIEVLRHKLEDAISADTLCELSALLYDPCCDKRCYELVSTGVINSLKSGTKQQLENHIWYKETRAICYQKLLSQDNLSSSGHVFLHTVATHQSTGEHWVIPAIAKEFELILRPLYEKKSLSKNAILCLMIVREFVGEWITQKEISDLHLMTFPEFTADDLSLPYSNLFESAVYHRNVSDLKHYIYNDDDRKRLKLFQLVYITWLFNKESLYPYEQENLVDLIKDKIATPELDLELASAKSLLIHHACELKASSNAKLQQLIKALDNQNTFSPFLDFIAENQNQIKKSLDGTKTTKLVNVQKKSYQGLMAVKNIIAGRTGISFPIGKKLKVAVCISGQLRGYKQAFETWKKSILIGVDYDIYVHSWKSVGGTSAEPFRKFLPFEGRQFQEAYREYCLTFGFDNMQQTYPTLFKYLKQSAQVTEQEIKEFYGAKNVVLDDESTSQFDGFTNSDKMHYKIHACHKLMKNSGQKYDLVIRIRPDFSLSFVAFNWNDIYDWCNAKPIIFTDFALGTNYMSCMMGDQFAVGKPETLEIYANTWDIYPKLAQNKIINCDETFAGHHSIAMNCWAHNIKIEKLPMKKSGLLEAGSMKSSRIYEAISIDAKGRDSLWDQKFLALLEKDAV
ncbi:MAG: hypothetical protein SFU55_11775 [Methylophilus sp.]|nr:hypothetical protein [Methylophilus sp.]